MERLMTESGYCLPLNLKELRLELRGLHGSAANDTIGE
jgi:hypothetical protein